MIRIWFGGLTYTKITIVIIRNLPNSVIGNYESPYRNIPPVCHEDSGSKDADVKRRIWGNVWALITRTRLLYWVLSGGSIGDL